MRINSLSIEKGKQMYIYLKKDDLSDKMTQKESKENSPKFLGSSVYDAELAPHIIVFTPPDVLILNKELEKFFLKATGHCFPKYFSSREVGVYILGEAKGELTCNDKGEYFLKIETDSFKGLKDMELIQIKIAAGKIAPTTSYERKQARLHPLEILRQLLASRNLTSFQRFFLALRLTR